MRRSQVCTENVQIDKKDYTLAIIIIISQTPKMTPMPIVLTSTFYTPDFLGVNDE